MTSSKGFTLIELMIVVVVVAILAGIAYPSYQGHTVRVRRSDAQMALTRAAALQEKFYADCTKYAVNLHSSNATDCTANRLKFRTTTEGGFYTISVAAGTIGGGCATNVCGFTLTATGIGNQAKDGPLRIDSTGRKEWNRKNAGTWVSWNER